MYIVKPGDVGDHDPDPVPPKKYNPADFIVAPCDSRGASYRKSFRVMPDMDKAVEQVLASHRFPFTTFGDFCRWALREGLRTIDRMEPTTTVMNRVDIISALLQEENDHADFLATFTTLEQTVQKYINDQAPAEALRVVTRVRDVIHTMDTSEYWKARYLAELQTRIQKYASIAALKGISLSPVSPPPPAPES